MNRTTTPFTIMPLIPYTPSQAVNTPPPSKSCRETTPDSGLESISEFLKVLAEIKDGLEAAAARCEENVSGEDDGYESGDEEEEESNEDDGYESGEEGSEEEDEDSDEGGDEDSDEGGDEDSDEGGDEDRDEDSDEGEEEGSDEDNEDDDDDEPQPYVCSMCRYKLGLW